MSWRGTGRLVLALASVSVLGGMSLFGTELQTVTPAKAGLSPSKLAEVDQYLRQAVADQKMAGAVVIVARQGKIGFFNAYGQMDREAGKPMRPDTIFRIYSMSKAITTVGALMLVEAHKLSLDDPVSRYIPSFARLKVTGPQGLRPPTRSMTVRDLMLHTSGLSYGSGPDPLKEAFGRLKPLESLNLEQMVEKLSQVPLAFDPGSDWLYGVSTDVLGRIIEVASGQPLDVYLRRQIFQPLDMPDTGFSVPPDKLDRFAANYSRSPQGLKLIDAPANSKFAKPTTFFSGGGSLVSTARDYMRFLTLIERGGKFNGVRLLRPATIKLMTSNQLPPQAFPIHFDKEIRHGTGFGLGFNVRTEITSWDPAGHVGEYGWGGAASTHYWVSPSDKMAVVTLEQIMPYQWDTEFGIKRLLYEAVCK